MTHGLPDGYELRTADLTDDGRARAWFRAVARGFHEPFREREMNRWRDLAAQDRPLEVVIADRGDDVRLVATSTSMPRTLSLPYAAEPVPTAAVTAVTVQPEHRRLGLMRAMMRRMLDDARAAAEPLAALYASEASIYGRFGFGMAVEMRKAEIPTRRVAWHDPPELRGRLRVVDHAEAIPVIVDAARVAGRTRAGLLNLRPDDLRMLHDDPEDMREGGGERQLVTLDDDRGVVAYRIHERWTESVPNSRLKVEALWGVDAEAERALVAYCCGVDLVETVVLHYRPVDDWLLLAVDDHMRVRLRREDPLYVRILDVAAALGARGSTVTDALVLEVHDPFLGAASGRWRWEVEPGASACERTEDEPDVVLDVRELGSLLLGGVSAHQLASAGRLRPRDEAALDRVAHAFGCVPAPWSPITF